jgi:hypothetical protein
LNLQQPILELNQENKQKHTYLTKKLNFYTILFNLLPTFCKDLLFRHSGCFSGAVATEESVPILNFFGGFCRGKGVESFYGDDPFKNSIWWSRSSQEGNG